MRRHAAKVTTVYKGVYYGAAGRVSHTVKTKISSRDSAENVLNSVIKTDIELMLFRTERGQAENFLIVLRILHY